MSESDGPLLHGRPARTPPRSELLDPAALEPERRALYDAITSGPRAASPGLIDDAGHLLGPFHVMLHAPSVGGAVQELGRVLRFDGALTPRSRELAILTVGSRLECWYEWWSHERPALVAGVTADEMQHILDGTTAQSLDGTERRIVGLARQLAGERYVDDRDYRAAAAELGPPVLAELVWLVGYYSMLALAVGVFGPG